MRRRGQDVVVLQLGVGLVAVASVGNVEDEVLVLPFEHVLGKDDVLDQEARGVVDAAGGRDVVGGAQGGGILVVRTQVFGQRGDGCMAGSGKAQEVGGVNGRDG